MQKSVKWLLIAGAVLIAMTLACTVSGDSASDSSANQATELSLKQTELALDIQQLTVEANQSDPPIIPPTQGNEMPAATLTQPMMEFIPSSTTAPTATATETLVPTSDKLILNVMTDRKVFYCVSGSGPTTLTITVELSDIDEGMAVYWRLEDKVNGNTTDWELKDLHRAGGNNRSFTFNADVWAGTNNFFYPPLFHESWFEYQIIADSGKDRTEVFADVTFFPCAQ